MKEKIVFYVAYGLFFCSGIAKADDSRCIAPCPAPAAAAQFCNLAVTQNLCVSGTTQLNGNLTVCGSFTGPTVTTANYVYSYDTTPTQTVDVPNTFQDITFNTDVFLNGWQHISGTAPFTCNQTGFYLVQYHAIVNQSTNQAGINATMRAALNGIEVNGSALTLNVPETSDEVEISNAFLLNASVSDVLTFQFTGGLGTVELIADQNSDSNVIPSITITIIRIA